jgi:plastocyanin
MHSKHSDPRRTMNRPHRPSPARRNALALTAALLLAAAAAPPLSAAEPEVLLMIREHKFEPAEFKVPANQRVKLVVHNQDATPEEFESHALNREKVVPPRSKATIYIGPLKPGRYPFVGEFHEATAKGVIVAE